MRRRRKQLTATILAGLTLVGLAAAATTSPHSVQNKADDPVDRWVAGLQPPGYALVRQADLAAGAMIGLEPGGFATSGPLEDGVWLSLGGTILTLEHEIDVPAGWLLQTGPTAAATSDTTRCRVTCRSGYYACCWINGHDAPVCRCRRNGTPDGDCQAGGDGSEECEIERGTTR